VETFPLFVWFALHLVAVKLAEKKKKTELPVSSLCPASLLTERRNKDRKRKATFSLHNPREDSKKRKKRKLRKRTTTRRRKEHKRRKTQHRPKHTPKKKGNERWKKRKNPFPPQVILKIKPFPFGVLSSLIIPNIPLLITSPFHLLILPIFKSQRRRRGKKNGLDNKSIRTQPRNDQRVSVY